MISKVLTLLLIFPFGLLANPTETQYQDGHQSFTTYTWQNQQSDAATVFLLSGPNDHWNSDAAWWVSLAPVLQNQFHVVAIERPSQSLGNPNPTTGYINFARQVTQVLDKLNPQKLMFVAFAASNMTVLKLLQQQTDNTISQVILIDPDVLTDFSIARYKSDAKPFKDNLEQYTDYILEGKYTARVQQKTTAELEHINHLQPNLSSSQKSWLNTIMKKRENLQNQVNLFREIAMYGEDLDQAKQLSWPDNIHLTIIDTDFEQNYIDNSEDLKAIEGLKKWREDAVQHYQTLTVGNNKNLLIVNDKEHLYQVLAPEKILSLLLLMPD